MTAPRSTFRPFRAAGAERSDRSAGDRARHRRKVRESIRDNISDIVAEESIIGQDRDRIIKVPIRGIKEFRFVYGDNTPGVGQGGDDVEEGQRIGRTPGRAEGSGRAGGQPGVDYYETEITLEELVDIMFEDLELPELERKNLREVAAPRLSRRKGYRPKGIRVHLDKRETVRAKIRRQLASQPRQDEGDSVPVSRFPFREEDLTYRHRVPESRPESNAAVLCIMDTSGSMDTMKKYLARSFFFLLYQFILTKYRNVEVAFIAHHTEAREVSESEFFRKGEAGGTMISSGYQKALDIIEERFHPSLWNIYAFHCSDGDNFDNDTPLALRLARQLIEVCNLFGYGEIKPLGARHYESSMLGLYRRLQADNFHTVLIEAKEDVWPSFRALLKKDEAAHA